MHLEPHDYRIYYVNIDLRHQYGISVAESQTFLRAKRPQRRRARRNGCFRRLTNSVVYYVYVTYDVTFHSAYVRLNGSKLYFKNVRYPDEIGLYQCVSENPHGMIVSYTRVNVSGKHMKICVR